MPHEVAPRRATHARPSQVGTTSGGGGVGEAVAWPWGERAGHPIRPGGRGGRPAHSSTSRTLRCHAVGTPQVSRLRARSSTVSLYRGERSQQCKRPTFANSLTSSPLPSVASSPSRLASHASPNRSRPFPRHPRSAQSATAPSALWALSTLRGSPPRTNDASKALYHRNAARISMSAGDSLMLLPARRCPHCATTNCPHSSTPKGIGRLRAPFAELLRPAGRTGRSSQRLAPALLQLPVREVPEPQARAPRCLHAAACLASRARRPSLWHFIWAADIRSAPAAMGKYKPH
jgi:hypothetical protein